MVLLFSCVLTGSGIRTVSGMLDGSSIPTTIKIGLFPPGNEYTFEYDKTEDDSTGSAEKDMIFRNISSNEKDGSTGNYIFAPVPGFVVTPESGQYSIIFPEDPTTVKCLIAWDDINGDGQFDLGSEDAFLPVKKINGTFYVIHYFSSIEVVENITYLAVYSTMDREDPDYDLDFYDPHQDNFDAIGADGFDFNIR